MDPTWFVYLIRCDDNSLYTGISKNPLRRFREHFSGGRGARYFSGRTPVKIVHLEKYPNRSTASRREYAIKQLKKEQKEQLICQSLASTETLLENASDG